MRNFKGITNRVFAVIAVFYKKREFALLENDVFVACIFLDPRYKVLLNEEEKTSTIAHLQNTWISLQNLKSHSINFTDQNRLSPDLRNSSNDDDDLEVMLKAHELESAKQKVFIFLSVYFIYLGQNFVLLN